MRTMTQLRPSVDYGPAVGGRLRSVVGDAAAALAAKLGARLTVNVGWDAAWERRGWAGPDAHAAPRLSVRLMADEVLAGPYWLPGTDAGCPACAEYRDRLRVDHPLLGRIGEPTAAASAAGPFLTELALATLLDLAARTPAAGELRAAGVSSSASHRIRRSLHCPVCAEPRPAGRPGPTAGGPRGAAALAGDPLRAAPTVLELRRSAIREQLVDARFGPVVHVMRDSRAPFAMSSALLPDSPAAGYGRAVTFDGAEPVAVLEAYERMAGFPHAAPLLHGVPYERIADQALDPRTLGGYAEAQLAHPSSRVLPCDPATPVDWAWARPVQGGDPVAVPAEVAFYRYDYAHPRDYHASRRSAAAARPPAGFFVESSSGCALGGSPAEAALHSLLELAERDAFLLAWHRARPLPWIDPGSLRDAVAARLIASVTGRGFDVHLLKATSDIDVPVVWALAVNRTGRYPASYSAAGSGARPEAAAVAALWEMAQLVATDPEPDRAVAERLHADPWLMSNPEDQVRYYRLPRTLDRITAVLGGPRVGLAEAFPDWPGRLVRAAGGRVEGALDHVVGLFHGAGLDRILVVDQTTREHRDLGLHVAKAVVPGIVPMCFGIANQRLGGLARLRRALPDPSASGLERAWREPHPFP